MQARRPTLVHSQTEARRLMQARRPTLVHLQISVPPPSRSRHAPPTTRVPSPWRLTRLAHRLSATGLFHPRGCLQLHLRNGVISAHSCRQPRRRSAGGDGDAPPSVRRSRPSDRPRREPVTCDSRHCLCGLRHHAPQDAFVLSAGRRESLRLSCKPPTISLPPSSPCTTMPSSCAAILPLRGLSRGVRRP